MALYSFFNSGSIFDLTLPRAVLETCINAPNDVTSVFHFQDLPSAGPVGSEYLKDDSKYHNKTLTVRKLENGAWNLTNKKVTSLQNDKTRTRKYIIVNRDAVKRELEEEQDHMKQAAEVHINPKGYKGTMIGLADHDYFSCEKAQNDPVHKQTDDSAENIPDAESAQDLDDESVLCSLCPALLKDQWNLLKHVKRLHSQHTKFEEVVDKLKPLLQVVCPQCNKIFGSKKTLAEHQARVHQAFQACPCIHCGKTFRSEHHLKLHIKYSHLRELKSYSCEYCDSKFHNKGVLRDHIRYVHSNLERKYQCSLCTFKYAFNKQYYEHFARVHGPKRFSCPHCHYKCATKWYFEKHTQKCRKFSLANRKEAPAQVSDDTSVDFTGRTAICVGVVTMEPEMHVQESSEAVPDSLSQDIHIESICEVSSPGVDMDLSEQKWEVVDNTMQYDLTSGVIADDISHITDVAGVEHELQRTICISAAADGPPTTVRLVLPSTSAINS